jgi:hypothetical protein
MQSRYLDVGKADLPSGWAAEAEENGREPRLRW